MTVRQMTSNHTSSLLSRIEWILRERSWTHEQLGKYAGFNSRSYISALLSRLRNRPEFEGKIASGILEKIATGAHVSRAWLETGEGSPNESVAAPMTVRWANLEKCLLREVGRWSAPVIAAARVMEFDTDPQPLEWVAILDGLERAFTFEIKRLRGLLR